MSKILFAIFLGIMTFATAQSQKFGYLSSAELLAAIPEVATADKQLAAFQEGLIKGGQAKLTSFETNYKKYLEDVDAGLLSKIQQSERETALRKEQEDISKYEQVIQLQIMQKREELLQPILARVDEAIQAEGKAGSYTFIFDTSAGGAVVYTTEADDLLPAIKRRLGVQ